LRAVPTASEPAAVTGSPVGFVAGVRAFGVMLGGSAALNVIAAASVLSTARAARSRTKPRPLAAVGTVATLVYALRVRPWLLAWGATENELQKSLPGDDSVSDPGSQSTRAVTIEAPVEEVWPWLAQIGQDRGGFYSYEWLENLAGCRMRNADRIHPEWQEREVGEKVFLHPANGLDVVLFEPKRALTLNGWGAFVLEPINERQTRLIARGRGRRGIASVAYALLLEIPHFIMERRMLLGIKERAERGAGTESA
jgi:hypothetical protein